MRLRALGENTVPCRTMVGPPTTMFGGFHITDVREFRVLQQQGDAWLPITICHGTLVVFEWNCPLFCGTSRL